jgi:hypothetical protein
MEFKLGVYRHFKKGNLYLAYDITVDEETQKEKVSYMSLVDGKKHSRFLEKFTDDVSDRPDNTTGQKLRFELVSESEAVKSLQIYIRKCLEEEYDSLKRKELLNL